MPRKVSYRLDYDEDEYYDDYGDYDNHYGVEDNAVEVPEPKQVINKSQLWSCSICTYDNDNSLYACDICGVLRQPLDKYANNNNGTVDHTCKASGVSVMAKCLFDSSPHRKPEKAKKGQQLVDGSVSEVGYNFCEHGNFKGNFHEFHKAFCSYSHSGIDIAPFKFDISSPDDLVSHGLHSSKSGSKANIPYLKTPNVSSIVNGKNRGVGAQSNSKMLGSSSLPMAKDKQDGEHSSLEERSHSKNVVLDVKSGSETSDTSSVLVQGKNKNLDDGSSSIDGGKPRNLISNVNNMSLADKLGNSNVRITKSKLSYEPEKWMLPDKEGDALTQLNLAIVGHVDSGKSTLSGRLLHLLGRISQKDMHKYEKEAKLQGKGSFAYAWALDESPEERERGITMTVAVAYFDTKRYHVVVLDSPGHKDFVPNMISGATQADAAILVIDAVTGAFEAGMDSTKGQTREHARLIRSFGVEQIIVAINKMDVVGYSKERFDLIKMQLGTFLRSCNFKDSSISWIPVSAMENQNLVAPPSDTRLLSWFQGPNLLDAIDSLQPPSRDISKPLLMPICDVIRSSSLGQVSACGKLEAGALRSGSKVLLLPSGELGTVRTIERDSKACNIARAGDNVAITLNGIDGNNVVAGSVLCHPEFPVAVAKHLELKVIVLDVATPILIGSQLEFHIHHVKEAARVAKIVSLLDPKTGKVTKKSPRCLSSKQSAVIEVVLQESVCIEEFSSCRALGRVFLRALGRTVALGIVCRIIQQQE